MMETWPKSLVSQHVLFSKLTKSQWSQLTVSNELSRCRCKVVHTDHLVVETWSPQGPQLFKHVQTNWDWLAVLEVHIEGIEQSRNTTN